MTQKTLIVGDIHGCHAEFMALLDKAGLAADDEIIALGDIVDRGPDTVRVLEFFQKEINTRSLLGNHERKHIRSFQGRIRPALSQLISRRQIGEQRYPGLCTFMDSFVRFLELPEAILTHGFFEPNIPLSDQKEDVLIGAMRGDIYLQQTYDRPWYEYYNEDKPIVVGHLDYSRNGQPFIYQDRVFCIDTGCCHGGALTGLLLPSFRLISVRSKKDYWNEAKEANADISLRSKPDETLSWSDFNKLLSIRGDTMNISPSTLKRLARLKIVAEEADTLLNALFNHIESENERILCDLSCKGAFDTLSPKEQGSKYAATIGNSPLSQFLHLARKGELTIEKLRNRFKTPYELIEFMKQKDMCKIRQCNGEFLDH